MSRSTSTLPAQMVDVSPRHRGDDEARPLAGARVVERSDHRQPQAMTLGRRQGDGFLGQLRQAVRATRTKCGALVDGPAVGRCGVHLGRSDDEERRRRSDRSDRLNQVQGAADVDREGSCRVGRRVGRIGDCSEVDDGIGPGRFDPLPDRGGTDHVVPVFGADGFVAVGAELLDEPPPDEARRAGDEDPHATPATATDLDSPPAESRRLRSASTIISIRPLKSTFGRHPRS